MQPRSLVTSFTILALAGAAFGQGPQDILYYKFDETGGRKAVNYASGSGVAPAEGNIVGTYPTTHVAGVMGASSLAGGTGTTAATSNYTDSGWLLNLTNSNFTVAFYMKQRTAPPSTSYFFYSNTSFRAFTGGVANRGLMTRVWGGTPADLVLTTDLQTMAAAAWVHVALVIDATALTATYYVNGVAQPAIVISTGVTSSGGTLTFRAGNASSGGVYDIDEFRVSSRAASPAEIQSWLTKTTPADSKYGAGCNGGTLASSGGAPKLGNATYALNLGGSSGNSFLLSLGVSRVSFGAVPLPFDLGLLFAGMSGCNWESSGDLMLNGRLASSSLTIPLAIPMNPALEGLTLWCQSLLVSPAFAVQSTNGFAIGIGQ